MSEIILGCIRQRPFVREMKTLFRVPACTADLEHQVRTGKAEQTLNMHT